MAHQDSSDHRRNDSDAQDHTSMTIEFLRARLLAERAVSKSARAKLDGLSDKVAELEEQLKIVSLQRKKAEQATADVLSILEEHGFHEHDAYDSCSDQESYSQTTTHSVSAKSLSWKGRRREAGSSDKIKESRNRRQRGFVSAYVSSARHRRGRSCRQIKRSESRTVSEDHKRDGKTVVDFQGKGGSTEVLPKTSEEASTTVVDVTVIRGEESLQKLSCSNVLEKGNSMDIKLEKALRKRAQVVGSYEDMEETQKQWEKKFTENKSSALDVCDVGNHSDVTDESNGEKAQGSTLVLPSLRDTRSIANEVDLETLSHGSPDNSVTSPEKCCKSCGSKSVEEDVSPSGDNGKQFYESLKSESSHPQRCKTISEQSSSTIRSPPAPNSRGGSFCSNATTIQKVDYPLVPVAKESSDTCDTVLTALKQAKLSLQEKVSSLNIRKPEYLSESSYPPTPGSYMDTYALSMEPAFGTRPSLPASNVGSMLEFPVGCAGLFRVPTDFSPDASTRNSFLASSSQKALVNHIPERDIPLLPGDQRFTKTLLDTERPLTTPYIGGPKLWTGFREGGQTVVDTQESRLCKDTPRVSGSVRTSGFEGNQLSSRSFNSERKESTYTPLSMSPSRSLYPDSVVRSREMYSTPYYTRAVGLPPTGGSSDDLFRRV
ncbi:hypothetical protein Bca4012_040434 [Brassica carinata]|uniref:Uncharacterized protein n=1 Tax=Brassica carinata TaxID=52824 RepID=A0A8X8B683_BRACI|nr:hypothetical protein Bca52824_008582 [Brassica carinata]